MPLRPASRLYYRHALPVRVMHWINALALLALLGSGLQIFNAHPALYWGQSSYAGRPPLLAMPASESQGELKGTTVILGHRFDTTGVFGASGEGEAAEPRGFPSWATIPGNRWLAMGRRWHFFFAWVFVINGFAYLIYSVASRHLRRDLWPSRADLASFGRSLLDHLRFRHPRGAEALHYNVLQKISYLLVVLLLLPGMAVLGLALSPRIDALWPGWVEWLGGRQ
jgi:thiosulfate reductase cytochrome b subunit